MTLEHKNEKLQELISSLKKQSIEHKTGVWKRLALELREADQKPQGREPVKD